MNWWELPGPGSFVEAIADDLRDGKNVVVVAPAHTPAGLRQAILQSFGRTDFHVIKDGEAKPIDILFQRFSPVTADSTLRDASTFLESVDARSSIICVEEISLDRWPQWHRFLLEYQHCLQDVSLLRRKLFCVFPDAASATTGIQTEVRLSTYRYDGYAGPLDALLYAALRFPRNGGTDIEQQVGIAATAALALWDPELTDRLVSEPLSTILDPANLLLDLCRERGWSDDPSWPNGTCAQFGSESMIHSAVIASKSHELEARIWSAEVGVVFPRIEKVRQRILSKRGKRFRIPYETRSGQRIEDYRDLEINHIRDQLHETGAPQGEREAADQLARMRNYLAHLVPLDPSLLRCFEAAAKRLTS